MDLTATQTDALTELLNIGYGRAARALSELTGDRISLEVPKISMHPIEQIPPLLDRMIEGDVASISQVFSGQISGKALLMMDEKSAMTLSRLLSDDGAPPRRFSIRGQEIITEVGNILLNACLSVFGNLLKVRVTFAVPRLHVSSVGGILKSTTVESEELAHALMIHTPFRLRSNDVAGFLIIILGVTSLERMLQEVAGWEARQLS